VPGLYPQLEPYDHGLLDVGDGNAVYWETCGNPDGKPALYVHGGPGSGCTPASRRFCDPEAYRIVLLDQRNCGRSTPHASEPATELAANTTAHLVRDLESLREHLGIERWLVLGGSWGSTLALAYAEAHTARVTELVLFGVTTGRHAEADWLFRGGLSLFFPGGIVTHYVRNDFWVEDGALLRGADVLAGTPAVLINGRYDFQSPLAHAWTLKQALPHAELVVVDEAGHGGTGIDDEIVRATTRFAAA
jgi:pimeloyl-ACP methyl ester carboxylesterase